MKKNSIFLTSGAPLSWNLQNQTKLLSVHDLGLSGQLSFDWPDWKYLRLNYSNQQLQQGTSLQPLSANQRVLVQNPITKSWNDLGTITKVRPLGRSYEVLMDSGKTILRNRTLLRPILSQDRTMKNPLSTPTPSQQQSTKLRRWERLSKKTTWRRC